MSREPVQTEHALRVEERVNAEYGDRVTQEEVRRLINDAFDRYGDARITQFVPVLVDREVRARLRSATRADARA
jgi:hypothetical protein